MGVGPSRIKYYFLYSVKVVCLFVKKSSCKSINKSPLFHFQVTFHTHFPYIIKEKETQFYSSCKRIACTSSKCGDHFILKDRRPRDSKHCCERYLKKIVSNPRLD
jgi:hypothetical protein